MLDTNTVSHFVRQHPAVVRRVVRVPIDSLCVSAITAGELWYGLAKRPEASRLRAAVTEFLRRIEVVPWNVSAAERYGTVRATSEQIGRPLGPLDLLIAAQALDVGSVLVTNDQAFRHIAELPIEDWTVN